MAARASILLAAGTAFATGVAATVAFHGFNAGSPPVTKPSPAESRSDTGPAPGREHPTGLRETPKATNALPENKLAAAEQTWSEPVKRPGAPKSSDAQPREPLVFRTDERAAQTGVERSRSSARPEATDEPSHSAQADAKAERARTQRARMEAPDAADASRAESGRNRAVQTGTVATVEKAPPRKATTAGLARSTDGGQPSLAADDRIRRVVTQPGRYRFAEASQPFDERPRPTAAARGKAPERDVGGPGRRLSSADSGGVMRWLMEPGGRF